MQEAFIIYPKGKKIFFAISAPLLLPLCEDLALIGTPCSTEGQLGLSRQFNVLVRVLT